jgi:hypothetical protein
MKTQKKPPLKFRPAPKKPASQPKPKPAATAASQAEPKTFDSYRIDFLERRVDLICDDLNQILFALGQLEERSGQRLRRLDFERATDAEKSPQ